jgi:hypothetical protein
LQTDHASEVDQHQRRGERSVDEGAVDEQVYVVEAILQDGKADGKGNPGEAQHHQILKQRSP